MPSTAPTGTSNSKKKSPSQGVPVCADGESRRGALPPGYDSSSTRQGSFPPSQQKVSDEQRTSRPSSSLPVRLWRTIKSIFFASTPAWQMLKSGALVFFGFFCWSASNLLLSYEPTWHWLYFFMAYGVLLVGVGPLTHLVLVPHVVPWLRRQTRGTLLHTLGRHLIFITFTLFFTAVLWMGLSPPSFMQIEFRAGLGSSSSDIVPTLICSASNAREVEGVTCHLEQTAGVGSITVETGERQLLQASEPPFSFSVQRDELVEVVGERQFQVVVHNEEGAPVRRFSRTLSTIR